MNASVGAFDAKTNFSKLLERAENGETIIVTRHGRPVAKIGPVDDEAARAKRKEAIEKLMEARKGNTLGGLSLKDLINEGRRF
jgi:prevent-host-death family protein